MLADPLDPGERKTLYQWKWNELSAAIEVKTGAAISWAEWLRSSWKNASIRPSNKDAEWFRRVRSGERLGQRDDPKTSRLLSLLHPLQRVGLISEDEDEFGWIYSWLFPQRTTTVQDAQHERRVIDQLAEQVRKTNLKWRGAIAKNDRHTIYRLRKYGSVVANILAERCVDVAARSEFLDWSEILQRERVLRRTWKSTKAAEKAHLESRLAALDQRIAAGKASPFTSRIAHRIAARVALMDSRSKAVG